MQLQLHDSAARPGGCNILQLNVGPPGASVTSLVTMEARGLGARAVSALPASLFVPLSYPVGVSLSASEGSPVHTPITLTMSTSHPRGHFCLCTWLPCPQYATQTKPTERPVLGNTLVPSSSRYLHLVEGAETQSQPKE